MPSPRSSPAMRPTSPLSPGHKQAGHFDSLQPPQQRSMHPRANSSQHQVQQQRRSPNNPLRLPSLPRFHPANFPSGQSSAQSTPDGNSHVSSPQPPISPRAYQRMYSEAQKQLYFHQRDFLTASAGKPTSPRLQPLGSPGPVTPLELEGDEGYLIAGARSVNNSATPSDVAERMMKAEMQRLRGPEATTRQSTR
ncbi:hypothetical protein Slin15195_G007430 [Septoria linicola]|uniref:Uncharacterized protein n=1 Tax=Septoria linicola TaxID=215465 RepID=A0A9Q9AGX9_9PEZI|nr:hypothetical protein Slin14017_G007440 [Septoria linicola]USW47424.1 hypothetical protein Slin15195_G007430 [Septoria linicola]